MTRPLLSILNLPRSPRALTVLALVWILLPVSGCGGCSKAEEQPEAATKKQREEAKKEKEKPKPDFELPRLYVEPVDPNRPILAAKPGHWLGASLELKANNFDLIGQLQSNVVRRDGESMAPVRLDGQQYWLESRRPAVLAKGQARQLSETLLVPFTPRQTTPSWVRSQLQTREGSLLLNMPDELLDVMPAYQYYFCLLAREPARYKRVERLGALRGPGSDSRFFWYRCVAPQKDKFVLLPSTPLAWTSIAGVLWDDLDPSLLTPDQQQSLVDWLHWGGMMAVSGPDTLDRLRGSFLDSYLPATAGAARPLTADILAPLAEFSTTEDGQHTPQPIRPVRSWNGVTLRRNPEGEFMPHTGELVAERRVGRGRIVVSAFRLSQRELQEWPGCDTFWNACILRHPPRRMAVAGSLSNRNQPDALDLSESPMVDPRFVCGLRYFARDLASDGTFRETGAPASANTAAVLSSNSDGAIPLPNVTVDDDGSILSDDGSAPSVAGWNDFSAISSSAREALRSAAGIVIPRADFVVWMVLAYLAILGPVNWGFFKLLGRAEWAWAATPVIALVGAVVVTRAAHLNIGFARAQKEIDVLELQQGYPRGHLTRYAALYTSLSTRYEVRMDDAQALIGPLAIDRHPDARRNPMPLTLSRQADLRLTGFDISSNSTALLHGEQMIDVGGGLTYSTENGRPWVYNGTRLTLRNAIVLRRTEEANLESKQRNQGIEVARLGDFPPGKAGRRLEFTAYDAQSAAVVDPQDQGSADPQAGRISLVDLKQLVAGPRGFEMGDVRLVAELDEPLPGIEVLPEASQPAQVRVLVVAHLRHASWTAPGRDISWSPNPSALPEEPVEPEPAVEKK